jgi:exopolyphosphatase/guanosine-5'-triphosphate,3'-diphosphate pyrophosphatase
MQRTLAVLEKYATELSRHQVRRLRVTGTSAARDAENRSDFFARVRGAVGTEPELLSGQQEAALAFAGATHGRDPKAGPFVTLDIGGGSTEFAFGQAAPESSISLNLGCVRVTERFFASDPPSADELGQARDVHLATELGAVAASDQQAYGVASDIDRGNRAHGRWGRRAYLLRQGTVGGWLRGRCAGCSTPWPRQAAARTIRES